MSGSGSLFGRSLIPWRMNSVVVFLSQTSPKKLRKAPAVVVVVVVVFVVVSSVLYETEREGKH